MPSHPWWAEHGSHEPLITHLNILLSICDAIDFAHTHQILHMDLKMDNVMIGAFGEVYVLDWGLACKPGQVVSTIVGTPCYMAPEMLKLGEVLDVRTDVFLLGACLHYLLTGGPRYHGSDLRHVFAQAALAEPVQYSAAVASGLGRIANRACSACPEDRPASVREFAREIIAWLNQRASLVVVDAAMEQLQILRQLAWGEGASRRVEAFAVCHFGFKTALNKSTNCQEARDGLEAALRLMLDLKLEAEELEGAEALIGELESIGIGETTQLRATVAIQRTLLEQRRNAMDIEIGARERLILISIFLRG